MSLSCPVPVDWDSRSVASAGRVKAPTVITPTASQTLPSSALACRGASAKQWKCFHDSPRTRPSPRHTREAVQRREPS